MKTYLITIITLMSVVLGKAQTASFTFTTSGGTFCTPQTVHFVQTCTGSPVSYVWDFGNGVSGDQPIEDIIYLDPGTYTVTLTAIYANSTASATRTFSVSGTPTVGLAADRPSLCQPGVMNFIATSDLASNSYEWNFGDGSPVQTTTGNTIAHNYTGYGSYTASVKVVTPGNCSATKTLAVDVTKLNIAGSLNPTGGCIPTPVSFSLATTFPAGDGLQNILWDFGDGSPQTNNSVFTNSHTYNTTTPITTAYAVITSNQGCTNRFDFPTHAYGNPPTDIIASTMNNRDTFCGSETITFSALSNTANTYTWSFGDGNTAVGQTVTHRYAVLGNEQVIVKSSENGCFGVEDTLNIVIKGVIAKYTLANSCSSKSTYAFTNQSLGNVSSYAWIFSDNPGAPDVSNYNTTHTFLNPGTYTSTLLVIDNTTGCRDSMIRDIVTANPTISASRSQVCRDSAFTVTLSNSYPTNAPIIYNNFFHLNGLILNNGPATTLTINPSNYGVFNDYIVIADGDPNTCDDTLRLPTPTTVRGPVADFTVSTNICLDSAITIVNNSHPYFPGDAIVKWIWSYGDGDTTYVQNPPTHYYSQFRAYPVSVFIRDVNGCEQRLIKNAQMLPLPAISTFPAVDTLCSGARDTLIAYSADPVTWQTTGPINCTTCDTVFVNPTTTTMYIAKTVNSYGCKGSDTTLIKVYQPFTISVTPATTQICPGASVPLLVSQPGLISWSPSQTLSSTTTQQTIARPVADQDYQVIVKDSVGCFADTAIASVTLYPNPSVDAGPDQLIKVQQPFSISPIYGTGVNSYTWTPSTGLDCSNCPTVNGTAVANQTYVISVSDANGCKGKDSVRIIIACERSNLHMPNAFTPDGNGINDYFYPLALGFNEIKRFVIFDRTGKKVFERQNFQAGIKTLGWDGRINGDTRTNMQTFTWFVEATCDKGETIFMKGTVILIR